MAGKTFTEKKTSNSDKDNSGINIPNEDVTLQDYLKYLRESHGYSQEIVADVLHVIRQTYSHYECGRIVPPVNALFSLASFYDIPAEILIRIAEADYKRSMGDESIKPLDDLDEWMDDIRVDFEVRPRDIKDYNEFIENNGKRYEKLRRDERCCLYYYNAVDDNCKTYVITNMKISKAMNDNSTENNASKE
ncbi:MAG: helix-turn-helix transcriptional regulator [Lachnospiraceae bacterium]|nr:helix-turn-helix transcriptional regulator [Lachnospiraceae bacterium]